MCASRGIAEAERESQASRSQAPSSRRTDVRSASSGDAQGCARDGACARRALNFFLHPPRGTGNHDHLPRAATTTPSHHARSSCQ
jgi:hypothetical protein